ncbi:hypothetical protein ACFYWS_05765 [Streptomyces sp. NPDC002795]|uniref:hypothetical protein n=1 Tax=Streptomyces sp. NPDC002795 TaxID=3364665 RepID=UPI003693142A
MRRRKRNGTTGITSLQRVRDRAQRRRGARRARSLSRRIGRRAERVRPWLQILADVAALLARAVR